MKTIGIDELIDSKIECDASPDVTVAPTHSRGRIAPRWLLTAGAVTATTVGLHGACFAAHADSVTAQTAGGSQLGIVQYSQTETSMLLNQSIESVNSLVKRTQSDMPDVDAVSTDVGRCAIGVLTTLVKEAVDARVPWTAPHVSTEGDGDLMLRWTGSVGRTLSLHFARDGRLEYLKAWGTDIVAEMEDGALDMSKLLAMWCWTIGA